jgi:GNAT superfamily N-acetyltransferase
MSESLPRELFEEYIDERRASPIPGFAVEVLPQFTRYLPVSGTGEGMVMYPRIPEGEAERHIREQARLFASRNLALEWKVYDRDRPANLRSLLEAEGFAAHHDEVFMIRALDDEGTRKGAAPEGVAILPASAGNNVIDDIVHVQEETWDCAFPGLAAQLRNALAPGTMDSAIYCAYLEGVPVGTGWIDFTAGSRFADLHGGAVLEQARGRGIYTLLYERRVEEARSRGCRFLAVDAAPMSCPILAHKGFMSVCATYPMRSAPHVTRK